MNKKHITHGKLKVFTIETYHGLTTSKPLQLRCFQGG